MTNIDKQKDNFKNHVAALSDYGNIKVLDFKNPGSSNYQIRFIFEEDYCRLHISGDLGYLSAFNPDNMTYEGFSDFIDNIDYFKEKIVSHDRPIYKYDYDKALKDLKNLFYEYEVEDKIIEYPDEDHDEQLESAAKECLKDFSRHTGIGHVGYEKLQELIYDPAEEAEYIGRVETGILDLYMLAFKLTKKQIDERN